PSLHVPEVLPGGRWLAPCQGPHRLAQEGKVIPVQEAPHGSDLGRLPAIQVHHLCPSTSGKQKGKRWSAQTLDRCPSDPRAKVPGHLAHRPITLAKLLALGLAHWLWRGSDRDRSSPDFHAQDPL
ncbi:hypothetical protein P7K49_040138, partial [Saguinus oedipus]